MRSLLSSLSRPFLSRKEAFERGLKIQFRIDELRVKHNWSAQETATAISAAGEILPLNLHTLGMPSEPIDIILAKL